ncbi:MAG: Mu transposase C-terminal domain-containing protein [Bacteroidota bacterium]
MKEQIDLPVIPTTKITDEVMKKVDALIVCVGFTENITEQQQRLAVDTGIPAASMRRYCSQLRKLFDVAQGSPLSVLSSHPQLRQALEFLFVRKGNPYVNELVSARGLVRVNPVGGELLGVSDWLLALYCHPGNNAVAVYRTLKAEVNAGRILIEVHPPLDKGRDGVGSLTRPATIADLPAERSVIRWLKRQTKESVAVKRSRMSRSQQLKDQIHVYRPDEEYRPGGKLEADHTEDNTVVFRGDGKIAPLWLTFFVCARTSMIKGWNACYSPNSDSIAIAFKRAVTGEQLEVFTSEGYKPLGIIDAPDRVTYDRGKDFKSRYSKQITGAVDFNDEARRTMQRICELHYATPRNPQAKPHVERSFRSIQEILKNLPGFKGRNYEAKPDALATEMKVGSLLTEQEYLQLLRLAINTYNNREREELGGLSPVQFYLTHQQLTRPIDLRVLDFLMLKAPDRPRVVRNGYVRLFGEEYFADILDEYNGKSVALYYDPVDVGQLAVYIGGEFVTVAINKNLLGKTEREMLYLAKTRAAMNKSLRETIGELRHDISSEEAKAYLFAGEIANVSAVNQKLLERKTPVIVTMTGIESDAKQLQQRFVEKKKQLDADRKVDDAKKNKNPLSLINVGKLKG